MTCMKRGPSLVALAVVMCGLLVGCVTKTEIRPEVQMGRDDATAYLQHKMRLYRLVIRMQPMDQAAQAAYAQGIQEAFTEAGDPQANRVAEDLLEAAGSHEFTAAADIGAKHAAKQLTNARVQSLIGGSLNRGLGAEVGWKAGYIEGFRQAAAKERPATDSELLYSEAQAVYDALRSSL